MKKSSGKQIVMVGAGNVSTHLSLALLNAGHQIIQVYSRTGDAARNLADKLKSLWTDQVSEITGKGELYILAVSDSVLPQLVNQLNIDSQPIVHTSGSIGIEIFSQKMKNYGVIYPLQTFSKNRSVDFKNVPLIIEGNNKQSEKMLADMGHQISSKVVKLNSEDRMSLHMAAVFSCNFTNHLNHLASLILDGSNLPFELLLPLIHETAAKIETIHPGEAQTGPAIRNDQNVIKKHLDLLSFSPGIREVYELMSRSIYSHSLNN